MKKHLLTLALLLTATVAHAHSVSQSLAALTNARTPGAPSVGSAAFTLTDMNGHTVTQENLKGHYSLVFFGFTRCPDECPQTLSQLADVYSQLSPAQQKQLQVVMVSVDPAHDTPAVMKGYMSSFNKAFTGWTGTQAQVDAAAKGFLVYHTETSDESHGDHMEDMKMDGMPEITHSAFTYFMNPQGQFIKPFSHEDGTAKIAAAVKATILTNNQ
ncbi:MAG: redoxin domain-containing protein [Proteobacteria bacterium]|nr:redoxin domain-containing protein [Pseudomonadota bacterium]